ncbi:hypothetical protein GCK32_015199, partial [Trichostrongylus colubriformis]
QYYLTIVQHFSARENNLPNINEPFTLTISPKIWDLLATKPDLFNSTITSIKLPEKEGKFKQLRYKLWDGHFDEFSVPKTGVSFENMNNGIRLRVRNVTFKSSTRARLYMEQMLFSIGVRGKIRMESTNAELDVILTWSNFTFTPNISMTSNLTIEFTRYLREFNLFKSRVEKYATRAINKKISKKLAGVIVKKLNPILRKLKKKLKKMKLYKKYDIEWTTQNQTLRVAVKPKSSNDVVSPIKPIDKMLCAEVDIAQLLQRTKRSVLLSSVDVTCVDPVTNCEGDSCSYCTDVDINPHSSNALEDIFRKCLPWF